MRTGLCVVAFLIALGAAQAGQAGSDNSLKDTFLKARSGSQKDQFAMCYGYFKGLGVRKDLDKALKWCFIAVGGIPEEDHRKNSPVHSTFLTKSLQYIGYIFSKMGDHGTAKTAFTLCSKQDDSTSNGAPDSIMECKNILKSYKNVEIKKMIRTTEDLRGYRREMYNDSHMLKLSGLSGGKRRAAGKIKASSPLGSPRCGMTEDHYNDINNSYTTKEKCAKAYAWFKCMGYSGAIATWHPNKKGYCSIDSMYGTCSEAQNLMRKPGGVLCWDR